MTDISWPDELRTDRLRLRRVRPADADALFEAYASDPRVTRFLSWTPHRSADALREFLEELDERCQRGEEFAWVIQLGGTDPIGMVSVRNTSHGIELGYVLAFDHWGRGLMSEAVAAVVEAARSNPAVFRVWAYHDIENPASGRVMQKAGLSYEARLKRWALHPNVSDEPRDVDTYSWVR